jgi:tripartite-type tricarboxylate transporter receptor subunit TctC
MLTRRHLLAASAAGLVAAGPSVRALAQALKKPVHIIVGFPAGGGTDVIARILAEALRGPYASTVLVENKPGAAARIAVESVKNAEADGSVMLLTPDFPITLYPSSFRSLYYDPVRDFTPVAPAA